MLVSDYLSCTLGLIKWLFMGFHVFRFSGVWMKLSSNETVCKVFTSRVYKSFLF